MNIVRALQRLILSARSALVAVLTLVIALAGASSANAASPWWQLSSSSAPAHLQEGPCEGPATPQVLPQCGQVVVTAENLGDLPVTGEMTPVSITDVLPPGVRATGIARTFTSSGDDSEGGIGGSQAHGALACSGLPGATVTCTWSEPFHLPPFELLEVAIEVEVGSGASSGENEVRISGGEGFTSEPDGNVVAPRSLRRPLAVGGATPFGVEEYTFDNENEGGALDTQAGSHPFQQTTNVAFNQGDPIGNSSVYGATPPALPKDLHIQWPPGLIGNTTALPQCTEPQFTAYVSGGADLCPADTAVGVASVTVTNRRFGLRTEEVPLFNLVPSRGEPARFGFEVEHADVTIDPSVRAGGDYGIDVDVTDTSQLVVVVSSRVSVWGVPGAAVHDDDRGWGCMQEGSVARESSGEVPDVCPAAADERQSPFLTLPTSCTGPLITTLEADSWQEPGAWVSPEPDPSVAMPALDGCEKLPFSASLEAAPDVSSASSPAGLTVKVHVPQEASVDGEGLAGSDVKDTTVVFPEGVAINPSGANGLEACSEGLIGFTGILGETDQFTPTIGSPFCPDASKIGTVKITVPVIAHPLEGALFLATQNENPFRSLVANYIVAEDPISGVLVKLPGEVKLNQETGRIEATFLNTPQAPFENLEVHLFGGERAPLSTPSRCGTYTTTASFTPWSGNAPVSASSGFNITSGPNGSPCPGASLPFGPSLTGGTTNINAGGFSPLVTTIGREDGQQNLQSVVLHMPAGLSGMISNVTPCAEAQADAGTCGPESLIGETTVLAGVGTDPVAVHGGRVYITEPYEGAPFGLSIVDPVKAGPFDLEHDTANPNQDPQCDCVVVRAKIEINPVTAELTVTTDPSGPYSIPHIIDGVPVQIKAVNVTIDREHFTFNPTSCNPMTMTGTIGGDEGAAAALSVPFQATNCAVLKFEPKLVVTAGGHASKKDGTSLTFNISYPKGAQGHDAWFKYAKFTLPKQLPARLTTLQQACLAATFEANPANCPKHSKIGEAVVHTEVLPVPLKGPVYFVSYGSAKFPDAVILLSGDNVNVRLTGETFIEGKTGITTATFPNNPDVPFESIEVTLPTGEYSEFGANLPHEGYDFCGQKLTMATEFKASNGLEIHQNTPVSVTGCSTKIAVESDKLRGRKLTVTVYVPAAGKLKVSGKGVSSASKSATGQEIVTVTVHTTRGGKFKTKLKLTFTPSKGKKQSKSLALRI